jgi:hypothetical protein
MFASNGEKLEIGIITCRPPTSTTLEVSFGLVSLARILFFAKKLYGLRAREKKNSLHNAIRKPNLRVVG